MPRVRHHLNTYNGYAAREVGRSSRTRWRIRKSVASANTRRDASGQAALMPCDSSSAGSRTPPGAYAGDRSARKGSRARCTRPADAPARSASVPILRPMPDGRGHLGGRARARPPLDATITARLVRSRRRSRPRAAPFSGLSPHAFGNTGDRAATWRCRCGTAGPGRGQPISQAGPGPRRVRLRPYDDTEINHSAATEVHLRDSPSAAVRARFSGCEASLGRQDGFGVASGPHPHRADRAQQREARLGE